MFRTHVIVCGVLLGGFSIAAASAWGAQRSSAATGDGIEAAPRVLGPVDDAARVVLRGGGNPLLDGSRTQSNAAQFNPGPSSLSASGAAASVADQGAVDDALPVGRMLLLLQRSPAQQAALQEFIQAAHTPGNPSYHQWLTPVEFGRRYGPADSDVAAVTAWLESHGLTIDQVHPGRVAIEFSGTAGRVREAFQTAIHRYRVNGATHLATAGDPSVPAALAPVIAGLAPVNDFHPAPALEVLGKAQFNARTHQATPGWTYPEAGGSSFVLAPGDFATQYDINSVYNSGITGTGQTIAIISASNVDLSLVAAYRTLFGLSANVPQVVVDGADPGENDAATEAYLDVEEAGAVAPGATVILYTSAGTALTDGLSLAAYRAVEDDQAGIISVSYAECESQLGQSGNAFWSALWQQAAAQGQTVFVAAGDGGSAGCDDFDTQQVAYGGLAVNGIASTPYNVAVGGTDFYYSQYAGSSSAITTQVGTYWSLSSTTSPAVSLKKTVPEQTWNDVFGYNLVDAGNPANLGGENIVAGSGGASSAAIYSGSTAGGYPKPSWQKGTGVPADGVRDLPDVSLFAANGYNYSFYPICAFPGDCSSSNLSSSGTEYITGVGGTSVSTPAMAGIQALIDQNAGSWQGQADFFYYALAAKQPTAFHDVTVGGNAVACYPSTASCISGSTATNSSGYSVENGYAAGTGYDLATGLGSVDVANLIKYWNTVTFTPSSTTLSVSPSSFVHGETATISGTVTPTSGSGTPTGSVALTGTDGLTHYTGIDGISLTSGSFSAQLDNLPGGTYQLTAAYGGDGTFAASKSAPVTVTITPENDTLDATGWAWNPSDLQLYALSAGITLPYGAQIYLDAQPVSGNATLANQPAPATGTVTFTDTLGSAVTSSTQPLNGAGVAEWSTGVFAPGSHTISESYSGDASYNPSTASTSFTVIPGSTRLTVTPLVTTVAAGASVAVDVQLATGYLPLYGTLPTGNVTVSLGGKTATAAWQPHGTTGDANLEAVVTFSNVSAGILPVSATYGGDSNWLGSSASGATVTALSSKLTPTVTLAASSTSPTQSQSITLTATVAGVSGQTAPTGNVLFLSDGQSFEATAALSSGSAAITLPGYALTNGTNVFTAVYEGDSNYNSASSNAVNVSSAQQDFSVTALNAEISVSPSGACAATVSLVPINGFSGAVTLTASAPSGITAGPATASPTVSAATTDTINISVAASKATGIYPVTVTASGGGHVHTAQILVQVLAVAAPVFTLAPGTYSTAQAVGITDATAGATIYYTTNGTTPTAASTKYTGAISLPATAPLTVTIQAVAVASGYAPSSVSSATYVIAPAAAAPAFSPVPGSYTSAQVVAITGTTAGSTIYYTTNGSTPTTSSSQYTGAISVGATETIKAIAVAPGYSASAVSTAAYSITPVANGCPTGSGSCADNFTGASGTLLPTYNSSWMLAGGSNTAFTTGSGSLEVSGSSAGIYYYAGSTSNISQIAIAPSNTTRSYEKLACVRVASGQDGYCVGFSAVSSGNYTACYVMKNYVYLGSGGCGTVSAVSSHTLRLVASGTSTVTLTVYVDGVQKGTVTDSSSPYISGSPGIGLQGDGTPADSVVNEWQDYGATPYSSHCPTGSGSCVDNFTGASGTLLPSYNPDWVLAGGTNAAYTTGSDSAEISGSSAGIYYYAGSTSDTSQITIAASSTTRSYEKMACVRVGSGQDGYCVGFSAVSSGNYTACYVMKNYVYLGSGGCGTVSATVSHTLRLVASGTSTVTLTVYVDGVQKGTVTDSSSPYAAGRPGIGIQGDGTAADSAITEWQDYGTAAASSNCPTGSGSCMDKFTGASGTMLTTYNPAWVLAGGVDAAFTTGSDSVEIPGTSTGIYYYAGSTSDTSQITIAASSTTRSYEKMACVRVGSGQDGYCVGFSAVSSGNYTACYVMKSYTYLGSGGCGTVSATVSHTLTLVASGTSTVTLTVFVDGVQKGTVTDSSNPFTAPGSGFGIQGDGVPADSAITEWQDYASAPVNTTCPTGSGSCVDNFTGASGTLLPSYNPGWALAGGTNAAYTTGSGSVEIPGTSAGIYYYTGSTSSTSQITIAPSSTTRSYEKMACVRVGSGQDGYCVGFSAVSSGNYTACYVMKNYVYLGSGNCGTVSATASHTLGLVASGTSTVSLSVYVDGVLTRTLTDSSSPLAAGGPGIGLQGDGTPADSAITEWQDH